jgi:transcriptional regulator with XRE-family HTH domain
MDNKNTTSTIQAIWQGEFLRTRRCQLGLTTYEVAQKVGCTRPLISMWELGKASPTGHLLVLLAIALNNHPNDFYKIEVAQDQEAGNE